MLIAFLLIDTMIVRFYLNRKIEILKDTVEEVQENIVGVYDAQQILIELTDQGINEPTPVTNTNDEQSDVEEVNDEPEIEQVPAETENEEVGTTLIHGVSEDEFTAFVDGIKHWEGFRSKLYVCSGGVTTIGYGFTKDEIRGRKTITEQEAHRQLVEVVIPKHLKNVDEVVAVDLTPHQRLALASFSFNLGRGYLNKLVNGEDRLNGGKYISINKILPQYRKAGGVVRKGLIYRRSWELSMWCGSVERTYLNK